MNSSSTVDAIATACKRYGPGRWPLADRRDVGAGYAGAGAAFLAVLVFATAAILGRVTGVLSENAGLGLAVFGLYAGPFVVPAAFVSAFALARVLPERVPYYGAVAGALGVLGTYLVASALLAVVVALLGVVDPGGAAPGVALYYAALVGAIAFGYTFWLTLPLGCVSGVVHERSRGAA